MKTVVILQHEDHRDAGSLLLCLQALDIPTQTIRADKGQLVPKDAQEFSGIVVLDSERCALDPVPWLRSELALCKQALTHEVPLLGLGLGAQLLTMAAGGAVKATHSPSYGWTPSWLTPEGSARFAAPVQQELFNASEHSIQLPPGAQCLMFDKRSPNKGYALGPHLALLSPLELSAASLQAWCARKNGRLALAQGPDVQNRVSMLRALPERMARLNALAEQVFGQWAAQLPGAPKPLPARLAA